MKEPSFSQRLNPGWLKAELMQYYAMSERRYNKVRSSDSIIMSEDLDLN